MFCHLQSAVRLEVMLGGTLRSNQGCTEILFYSNPLDTLGMLRPPTPQYLSRGLELGLLLPFLDLTPSKHELLTAAVTCSCKRRSRLRSPLAKCELNRDMSPSTAAFAEFKSKAFCIVNATEIHRKRLGVEVFPLARKGLQHCVVITFELQPSLNL